MFQSPLTPTRLCPHTCCTLTYTRANVMTLCRCRTGGLFVSPSMLGTRGGGPIASTWCAMHYYGQNGYKEICRKLIETTDYLRAEVDKMPGIKVQGSPCMCSMGIVNTDKDINLYAVADQMEKLGGWKMEQNTTPQGQPMHPSAPAPAPGCSWMLLATAS